MKGHLKFAIFIALAYAVTGGDLHRRKKQVGTGVSFAFPALSFLSGSFGSTNNNNNNNFNNNAIGGIGGNLFGGQTFTRTLVSTVSTVTTASFRTCTVPVGAIPACAGRRKRSAAMMFNFDNEIFLDGETNHLRIEPTASIALIIGTTTLTDPVAVSEYLIAHQPSPNSIIYPPDITISEIAELEQSSTLASVVPEETHSTVLYPSDDSPDNSEQPSFDEITTTTDGMLDEASFLDESETTTHQAAEDEVEGAENKARLGLSRATVTTIIRVTSVATTLASGPLATLTIMYAGCIPPSLPVSGAAC